MAGGILVLLVLVAVFYGAGYAIASRWRKSRAVTAIYAGLIGLGLACLCAAVLFGACLCLLGNNKL